MNYKLTLQYDGTDFHGWQMQDGLRTVQGELQRVLSVLDGREVLAHGSGRTDAGVHAVGQVASASLEHEFEPEKLRAAINGNLERDVRVMEAELVSDDFHARYSARGKTYLYRVINSRVVSPFWRRYAHAESRPLDVEVMRECARLFLGKHDWTAFSSVQTEAASRVREVTELEINAIWDERTQARLLEFEMSANGFLRYMVRSIAGALLAVGRGEIDSQIISKAIETGTRPREIVTAPACGLTLLSVRYD
ncbi:MAG: tRNA pseudouridine(38-40) synthase TruA [Acidobacteria bacterium]|nr:tRNA pseudouridine(38-40) synthase TruA [Acidobacteriota bacterium]